MRVDSGGVGIEYEVTGEGRPVVLLHGFPDSGRLWRHQVRALADAGYKVIVPDMRGYGASDKPADVAAYNMLFLVSDVGAVLDHAGVERAHVVGHDWGAAVAWVLAAVAPERVDHLVDPLRRSPVDLQVRRLRTSTRSRGTCCSSSSRASPSTGCRTTTGPTSATGDVIPTAWRSSATWKPTPP